MSENAANLTPREITPEEFETMDKSDFVPLVAPPPRSADGMVHWNLEQSRWLRKLLGKEEPAPSGEKQP